MADSPQIEAMQRREHSPFVGGWQSDLPVEVRPKSEWGTLPELREACQQYAREKGYRFLLLTGDRAEHFSRLAFRAHAAVLRKEGRKPQGTLLGCFTHVNPVATRLSALLPLWLSFNCTDSLSFLKGALAELPKERPVLFAPVPNFAPAFDTVRIESWLEALEGFDVHWLGIDPRHYPEDLAGLFRFMPVLRDWCKRNPAPVQARLSPQELQQIAAETTESVTS